MSDAQTQGAIRAEVTATLRRYGQRRDPGLLQAASDRASREDGTRADP